MIKNVVIVNDAAYVKGGNSLVALSSAKALADIGYNVYVFSAFGPVDPCYEGDGIEHICLKQRHILYENKIVAAIQGIWNRKAEKELDSLLDRLNLEETIVHLHAWSKSLSPSIWKPIRKRGVKLVVTLHDFFLLCPNLGLYNYPKQKICHISPSSIRCYLCNCDSRSYPQKIWRVARQIVQRHEMKKMGKFSAITISDTNERLCRKSLSDYVSSWHRVQNPIELNEKEFVDIQKNNTYLFIARLAKEKGIEMFCDVMTELGLKALVLGDGYLLNDLKSKYPNIEFAGWVSGQQKDELIRTGKALVFTSQWYETYGLVVAEMMSYGIPCIVPDQCAAAEQVVDGKTGVIFKIADRESLKKAILEFEKMNLEVIQQNIHSYFQPQKLNMAMHTQKLIEVYESIAHKNE